MNRELSLPAELRKAKSLFSILLMVRPPHNFIPLSGLLLWGEKEKQC